MGGFTTSAFSASGALAGLGSRLFVLLCMAVIVLTVCLVAIGLFDLPLTVVLAVGLTMFVAMVVLQGHAEMRRDLRLLKNHALQLSDYESEINRRVDYIASVVERSGGAQPDELAKRLRAFNRELAALAARVETLEAPSVSGANAAPVSASTVTPAAPEPKSFAVPSFAVPRASVQRPAKTGGFEEGQPVPAPTVPTTETAPESSTFEPQAGATVVESEAGTEEVAADDSAAPRSPIAMRAARQRERSEAAAFRYAISGQRLSFHLMPIVSLPDRQPAAYTAIMRLKPSDDDADGAWLEHEALLARADALGLVSLIERKTLYNGARMLRSVIDMGKRMRLVCPLSPGSLADDRTFQEVSLFLETNAGLRGDIMLEIGQAQFRALSAEARQRIGLVAEAGFELAMTNVETRDLDAEALRALGFTQITAPVAFYGRKDAAGLVLSLAAHRIACVASGVESEADLDVLTNCDVALAQGAFLAGPRAVKIDLLRQGTARPLAQRETDPKRDTRPNRETGMAQATGAQGGTGSSRLAS